jgi:serine protease Do
MKKQYFLLAAMTVMMAATTATALAQDNPPPAPTPPPPPGRIEGPGQDNIVIRKKAGKAEKMTIVVDGDKITVNGKPIGEYKGDDVYLDQKRYSEKLAREIELAQMDKQFAEMDHQLANLDRQIQVEVEPQIRNAYRYHYKMPRGHYKMDAPMALTIGDGGEFNGEKHAFLGVTTEKADKGVRIVDLTDESAADKAGLAKGDIITELDGKKVGDHEMLTKLVREHKPGDEVSLSYLHDGKSKKAKVKLGESSGFNFNFNAPSPDMRDLQIEMPDMPEIPEMHEFRGFDRGPRLGVQVEDIPEGKGVKVNEVRPETPASKAGIQKDDIITHVDSKDIKDSGDMIDALKEAKDKSSFWISVQRKGAPVNLEVKIPKPIRKADL